MSLQPQQPASIPEETVRVARAAFPKGNVYMRMRDELGICYTDEQFAHLYSVRGKPGEPPWELALVTVMQFAEGLSDEQAAEAVRARIDWKYALGLELTDTGFDPSVLSEFRKRLVEGGAELALLDHMLGHFKRLGLLKARGKARTDSAAVLASIRTLSRLVLVGETLRAALNALASADPEWLRVVVSPEWYERYGRRLEEGRLPKQKAEREALFETIGRDGSHILLRVYERDAPPQLRALSAVEVLRRVWVQQYHAPQQGGRVYLRDTTDQPPGALLIVSPYDIEARAGAKGGLKWTGYKVHLTETCDEDLPHLIEAVQTTAASSADMEVTSRVHQRLADNESLPGKHLADSGYVDAAGIVEAREVYRVELIGPVLGDNSWQAQAGEGFDAGSFSLDWDAQTATCPEGHTSRRWVYKPDVHGGPGVEVSFATADCVSCPSRSRCTRGQGPRTLTLRQRPAHEALVAARAYQATPEFREEYKARAGVEGTVSQGVRAFGLRRARYIGLAKTCLEHVLVACAMNLVRAVEWLSHRPHASTRQSAFAQLAPPTLAT